MTHKSNDSSKSLNSFWEVDFFLLQINHWGSTRALRFAQGRHLEAKSMEPKLMITSKNDKNSKVTKLTSEAISDELVLHICLPATKMTRRASLA